MIFSVSSDAIGTTENACFRAFITLRSQFHLHDCSQRTSTEIVFVAKITPTVTWTCPLKRDGTFFSLFFFFSPVLFFSLPGGVDTVSCLLACLGARFLPHSEHRFPAPSSKLKEGCRKPVPQCSGVWRVASVQSYQYPNLRRTLTAASVDSCTALSVV